MDSEGSPNIVAAAIKYEQGKDKAPRLVAKGKGYVAKCIIEIAERHNISVVEDPDLVSVLSKLELYEEIPVQVYRAVAEILAFVYKLNKRKKESLSLGSMEK